MKRVSLKHSTLAVAVGLMTLTAAAHGAAWTVKDLGQPSRTATATGRVVAMGMNDAGQVVGYEDCPDCAKDSGVFEPKAFFTYPNGENKRLINPVDARESMAFDINNLGQMVGFFRKSPELGRRAFITELKIGSMIPFRITGSSDNRTRESEATAINDQGQVVGSYLLDSENPENRGRQIEGIGFITGPNGAGMAYAGVPLARSPDSLAYTELTDINNSGLVVGSAYNSILNPTRDASFFTDSNGARFQALLAFKDDAQGSAPTAQMKRVKINDKGAVAGDVQFNAGTRYVENNAAATHGDGQIKLIDLKQAYAYKMDGVTAVVDPNSPYPVIENSAARAINNRGQVVGSFDNGKLQPFITGDFAQNAVSVNSLEFTNFKISKDVYFREAVAINNVGQFVVNASNGHAYLISPASKP
jgi:uncharacterized membrane protein